MFRPGRYTANSRRDFAVEAGELKLVPASAQAQFSTRIADAPQLSPGINEWLKKH